MRRLTEEMERREDIRRLASAIGTRLEEMVVRLERLEEGARAQKFWQEQTDRRLDEALSLIVDLFDDPAEPAPAQPAPAEHKRTRLPGIGPAQDFISVAPIWAASPEPAQVRSEAPKPEPQDPYRGLGVAGSRDRRGPDVVAGATPSYYDPILGERPY